MYYGNNQSGDENAVSFSHIIFSIIRMVVFCLTFYFKYCAIAGALKYYSSTYDHMCIHTILKIYEAYLCRNAYLQSIKLLKLNLTDFCTKPLIDFHIIK